VSRDWEQFLVALHAKCVEFGVIGQQLSEIDGDVACEMFAVQSRRELDAFVTGWLMCLATRRKMGDWIMSATDRAALYEEVKLFDKAMSAAIERRQKGQDDAS
jgi:hypothetical protein